MHWSLVLIPIAILAHTVKGDSSESSSSYVHIISNSNLGTDFSINTERTSSSSSSSSSSTTSQTTAPRVTENSDDTRLFKFMFTETGSYFNSPVEINSQSMELRLDLLQQDAWVLNGDQILPCQSVDAWFSSYEEFTSAATGLVPATLTEVPEYSATICGSAGVFTPSTDHDDPVEVGDYGIFESFALPYLNAINATGTVFNGNISVVNGNRESVEIPGFQFLNAESANVNVGGIGFARNTISNSGILEGLIDQNIINYSAYSLYFNEFENSNQTFAMMMPGVVNSKYFRGDMYQFLMLNRTGLKFTGEESALSNELLELMIVPAVELTDVQLENLSNGARVSLKSKSGTMPVIFDTRTTFNSVPLDIIVNIAVQTDAFYNSEVNRWIVECDAIRGASASLNLQFHELTIRVPISQILAQAIVYDQELTFSNGRRACFLNLLPTDNSFAILGLTVLKSMYLAVDNEGQTVGIAQSNENVRVRRSDYFGANDTNPFNIERDLFNYTDVDSIAEIVPYSIPFASTLSQTQSITLEYSTNQDNLESLTIPARLSGIVISSGQVILATGTENANTGTGTVIASTSETSSENLAVSPQNKPQSSITGILLLIPGLLMFL